MASVTGELTLVITYLPAHTKVTSSIQTEGTVIVKSSDNVTFEAAESISLGEGFEVEEGGTFNVIIYDCD